MSVTARRRQVCWQGHLAPGLMYILFFCLEEIYVSKQQHQHLNIWQQAHCSLEIDDCSSLIEYFIFSVASILNGKEEKTLCEISLNGTHY